MPAPVTAPVPAPLLLLYAPVGSTLLNPVPSAEPCQPFESLAHAVAAAAAAATDVSLTGSRYYAASPGNESLAGLLKTRQN